MSKYKIKVPDGRTVTIEADTPENAQKAAQHFVEANPRTVKGDVNDALTQAAQQGQPIGRQPETQSQYDAALEKVRLAFYPDMPPDKFHEMAKQGASGLAPMGLNDRVKSGALLGLDDEISSGLQGAVSQVQNWLGDKRKPGFGEAFQTAQDLNAARKATGREDTGSLGDVVEAVGTMGSMGEAPRSGLMGPPAGGNGPAALSAGRGAETLGGNILRNATMTAVPSGVYGFGNTDGSLTDRLVAGGRDAAIGGLIGAGATIAGRTVNAARGASQPQSGLSTAADDMLTRAQVADGTYGGQGARNVANAGPDAMLADAGPASVALLDTAVQSSGRAATSARAAIEERVARQNLGTRQTLDRTLGAPQGQATAEQLLRDSSRPTTSAAYQAARAQPIDYSGPHGRNIETLLQRVPQEAIARANRLMRIRGERSAQIMAEIGDDGSVTFRTMPDVTQLDYITRALNEEARNGVGAGAMGGQTDIGSSLQGLSRDIRNQLRAAVPEYGHALDTAASPIAQREALQFGRDMVATPMPRDVAAMQVSDMGPGEIAAARQGVRSHIDEVVANVRRTASDPAHDPAELRKALGDLSSDAVRTKIALLLDPADAQALFRQLDEATASLSLRAGVSRNSATMVRTSTDRALRQIVEGGALEKFLEGKPINALQEGMAQVSGRTPADKLARMDDVYAEIAHALVTPRGQAAVRMANNLGRRGRLGIPALPAAFQPILDAARDAPNDWRKIMQALKDMGSKEAPAAP